MKRAVALLVVAGIVVGLALEYIDTARLRAELDGRATIPVRLDQVRTEHDRLKSAQVTPDTLDRLRADHEALSRIREQIAELNASTPSAEGQNPEVKRATESPAETEPPPQARPTVARAPEIRRLRGGLARSAWSDAGNETIPAAMETIAWSAATGAGDRIASLIVLGPETRAAAESMRTTMNSAFSLSLGTPEDLLAALIVNEFAPFDSFRQMSINVARQPAGEFATMRLTVQFSAESPAGAAEQQAEAARNTVGFEFRHQEDGWKLVVPAAAIDKYRAQLSQGMNPLAAAR